MKDEEPYMEPKKKLHPLVASSMDPTKISLFLKGIIPLILLVTAYLKFDISESDLVGGAEQIGMVITGLMALWGLIRKFRPKV